MCQYVSGMCKHVSAQKRKGEKMALLGLDLPPADTVRWSPHRKASVVDVVRSGAISLDEACQRYQPKAGIEAARLARMLDRGDRDGRRRWMRIKRAIQALQAPRQGEPH